MKRNERKNLEVERRNQRSHLEGKQPAMDKRTNHLKKKGKSSRRSRRKRGKRLHQMREFDQFDKFLYQD